MGNVDLRYHPGDVIHWLGVWAQERLWSIEDVRIICFGHRNTWNDRCLGRYKGTQYPLGDKEGEESNGDLSPQGDITVPQ